MAFIKKYGIICILLLAFILRVYNITQVPPAASMDESSIGWNAYSVIRTGADEFGEFPLVSQRGYDDWRRSTYLLLVAPVISILGLNVIAVRLPALLLSLATIWAVYRIARMLFVKQKQHAHAIALIVSFLLSISPWHVYLSRIGHESNAYISFSVFGLLAFLLGLHKKQYFLWSIAWFTLGIISYYAGQVFIPVIGLGLIGLYRKELGVALADARFRRLFVSIAVVCLGVVSLTFSQSAIVRFAGTTTFSADAHHEEYTKRMHLWQQAVSEGDMVARVRYSARLFPLEVFVRSYVSHFKPRWLFINSGSEPFKTPYMGFLYMWQIPFLLIGLYVLCMTHILDSRVRWVILLWLLSSPLPGSIATQAPHAMRTYPSVVTWQLITAIGIYISLLYVSRARLLMSIATVCAVVVGLMSFIQNYFVVFPREQSASFHYAFHAAVRYVLAHQDGYERIVFSNQDNLYQSYMVFLYESTYDPLTYRQQGGTRSGGYNETHAFGKYEFRPIRVDEARQPGVLYVGNEKDFAPSEQAVAAFSNMDGTMTIKAVSGPQAL
jgi:4-amino-4-deoxy-L-arabinose transferase-like glycosyltransferase